MKSWIRSQHLICVGTEFIFETVDQTQLDNCLLYTSPSPRDGKLTYLVSEVDVDQENWISRDRGFDPNTDEQIWGSEHGLLRFKRIKFFSDEINEEWLDSKT